MMTPSDEDVLIKWKEFNLKSHGRKHAKTYSEANKRLYDSPDHQKIRKFLSDHLKNMDKINRLCDLGCGTGRWFHAMGYANLIFGMDFSDDMLKKAKEKIVENNYPNISLVRCDIYNLPLKRNLFDVVVSVGVLGEHIPLDNDILYEIGRVLVKNGPVLFTVRKVGFLKKIKMRMAKLCLPLLSHLYKDEIELHVKSFHGRLDHNEQTIRKLANQNNFDIKYIEVISLTQSDFYFVFAQKKV